jgi:hypothetical protein
MKIYGADGKEMMTVSAIERQGSELVIKGRLFGTMPLSARLRPEDARAGMKLMSWRTRWFLLTLPFRSRI